MIKGWDGKQHVQIYDYDIWWWSTCSNIWLRGGMACNMFKYLIQGWDGEALEEAEKNREILADISKR